ncbi:hypothetical protein [Blattabacterium punctulatus]
MTDHILEINFSAKYKIKKK